ncbi:MAG: glutamate--tRNA ligase [Candidatus Curtissbacteria bacterium]|nr:glutamate--tRNA ligase [Candidatus Curtissbacteria bacterium]
MSQVRVRIAPSPTGIPHIGNTRTVLFNWLYARKNNGKFVVRIEDTDRKRQVAGAQDKILEILEFLGLLWDEGPEKGGNFSPYVQSERKELYKKYADELIEKGLAYEDEGAIRFKVEKGKTWSWQDLIHGEISFKSDVIEDFVIMKSDGFPTYHLGVVVDDHLMEISDVLRGDEWISSTPKHLMIFDALGWKPPKFGHLPVIVGPDKSKLSKRHGAKSVLDYRDEGYLPEALINFMALLGWSAPPEVARGKTGDKEKELFSLQELTEIFSIDRINTTNPVFNLEKLNWFNKKYLQTLPVKNLKEKIKQFSKKAKTLDDDRLTKIISLVRDRITTLTDFDKYSAIFFEKGKEKAPEKSKVENAKQAIESITDWDEESISQLLDKWIEEKNLQAGDFKNTLRLSVFADNTPPIYQSLAVLSKEEVLKRIQDAL